MPHASNCAMRCAPCHARCVCHPWFAPSCVPVCSFTSLQRFHTRADHFAKSLSGDQGEDRGRRVLSPLLSTTSPLYVEQNSGALPHAPCACCWKQACGMGRTTRNGKTEARRSAGAEWIRHPQCCLEAYRGCGVLRPAHTWLQNWIQGESPRCRYIHSIVCNSNQ